MRRVSTWLLAALCTVACAPDYAGTSFLCDGTHGCPTGQTCVQGRCAPPAIGDGVACGTATCGAGLECCVDMVNAPRCTPVAASGDPCPGFRARCDGTEDCPASQWCCLAEDPDIPGACENTCDNYACRDAADCPAALPNCCGFVAGSYPWKHCTLARCP